MQIKDHDDARRPLSVAVVIIPGPNANKLERNPAAHSPQSWI